MLDLVYHILSNDTDTNTAVGGRITADIRVQTNGTPAITMEWVSTDDLRFNIDSCNHAVYTVDVYILSKTLPECASVMGNVSSALERYRGTVNTAAGNTYNVVNCTTQNRTMEVIEQGDMVEGQITFEITA